MKQKPVRRPRIAEGAFGIGVLAGMLAMLAPAGCAPAYVARHPPPVPPEDAEASTREARLRAAEQRWRGTPYRYGGAGREGVDCSGFVMNVYQELFRLPLPRATEEQVRAGRQVSRERLQAGDLVFFNLPRGGRHVGIFLGRGEFAHAASSEGVTVSALDDPYWRDAFWTARRLLADRPGAAPPGPDPPDRRAASYPARRTGW